MTDESDDFTHFDHSFAALVAQPLKIIPCSPSILSFTVTQNMQLTE
jgi:hypothetical protein